MESTHALRKQMKVIRARTNILNNFQDLANNSTAFKGLNFVVQHFRDSYVMSVIDIRRTKPVFMFVKMGDDVSSLSLMSYWYEQLGSNELEDTITLEEIETLFSSHAGYNFGIGFNRDDWWLQFLAAQLDLGPLYMTQSIEID